ncbi:MAG: Lrp/AsnC family transcriptional regulator, partial [Euryarchaeota archaeon]|nr:Lrp/AsnC family transcriptional regulator [Euryarchaeota archaeon]
LNIMRPLRLRIDKKDLEIIDILYKNARATLSEIANLTRVSITAVRNRLSKLIRYGILQGFRADIDFSKLGLSVHALVGIKVDFETRKVVASKLLNNWRVLNLYEVTGEYDYIAEVIAKDLYDLREFLTTEMFEIPGIKKTETMVILKSHKGLSPLKVLKEKEQLNL